jgi:hypothetical protein
MNICDKNASRIITNFINFGLMIIPSPHSTGAMTFLGLVVDIEIIEKFCLLIVFLDFFQAKLEAVISLTSTS